MKLIKSVGLTGVVGVIGSFASIISLFLAPEDSVVVKVLLVVLIVSWAFMAITILQLDKFMNVKNEAKKLIKNKPVSIVGSSNGELRGCILSWCSFLERNKEHFPDSYEKIMEYMHSNLNIVSKDESDNDRVKTEKLQEAYHIVYKIISDISQ